MSSAPSLEEPTASALSPAEPPAGNERLVRLAPLAVVALACLFDLWVLRAQRIPTPNLNDGSVHAAMLRWAEHRISSGHLPFDASQFHHYQSFPHILGGLLAVPLGADRVSYWSVYLLLALWPLSVYWGARMLGWGRWPAALAALVSPLAVSKPSLGYEWASYTWQGSGVWAQLWGMWFLPLAVGSSARAMRGQGSYALAAVFVALAVVSHFQQGYLALLLVIIMPLLSPSDLRRRALRSAVVFGGALLLSAWLIVPLLTDERWSPVNEFTARTFYADSFGAGKVLGWLFTGRIFDSGRFPILSLLVAVGVAVCLLRWRRDERARVVLALFVVSLLLFFGRPTLGWVLNLLPGTRDMFLRRYVMGVHLAGIWMAGVGAAWMGKVALAGVRRFLPRLHPRPLAVTAVLVVALLGALAPAWIDRADYEALGATWMVQQRQADGLDGTDLDALVQRVEDLGGGRVYAGLRSNWGADYKVNFVPGYAWLLNEDVDGVGFTLRTKSLSANVEPYFVEYSPSDYRLFAIRYLIVPEDRTPPVSATLVMRRGRHTLWRLDTKGYLRVVDTVGPPIVADRTNLGARTAPFLRSVQLSNDLYPTVAFGGEPAAPPTASADHPPSGPAGRVVGEVDELADGFATGTVMAARPQMVAPSLVGVAVPAGRHVMAFRYRPYPLYDVCLPVAALALAGLILVPRWRRRTGRTPRDPGHPAPD